MSSVLGEAMGRGLNVQRSRSTNLFRLTTPAGNSTWLESDALRVLAMSDSGLWDFVEKLDREPGQWTNIVIRVDNPDIEAILSLLS